MGDISHLVKILDKDIYPELLELYFNWNAKIS